MLDQGSARQRVVEKQRGLSPIITETLDRESKVTESYKTLDQYKKVLTIYCLTIIIKIIGGVYVINYQRADYN